MPSLSYNNHFRFGYNGNAFNFRISPDDKWCVTYGPCERAPLPFREECMETARVIAREARGPIWVLFSGGADSEVTLQSFVLAKVPVQAAIVRFKNDLNIHDISYAVIACEKLNVPYRFFDLDILAFWEGKGLDYAARTKCANPRLLSTMWCIDQVDGFPIIGGGECYFAKRVPDDYEPGVSPYPDTQWDLYEKEAIASWYRHLMLTGRDGSGGFFQYTPELILSYLMDRDVINLVRNRNIGKLSTKTSKLPIYQKYFDLVTRPKFTGFEKIGEPDRAICKHLFKLYSEYCAIFKTPYDNLFEQLIPAARNKWENDVAQSIG